MEKKATNAHFAGPRGDWLNSLRADGFSIDEGHYLRSSGEAVAYVHVQGRANGPRTILFHGTGNDLFFTWQPLIKALLHSGRSVLCFDLDGHGTASNTIFRFDEFQQIAIDLQKFLETKRWNTHPYELVGYSLGALVILHGVNAGVLKPDKFVLLALPLRIRLTPQFVWNELKSLFQRNFIGSGEATVGAKPFRLLDNFGDDRFHFVSRLTT